MNSYEAHFGNVDKSVIAIGENAKAEGYFGTRERDDMAETLSVLLGIVRRYTDPAADEVFNLALAANREIRADKPQKDVFQRLVDATRKMMKRLGSSVIGAGELADAVTRISELIRHL